MLITCPVQAKPSPEELQLLAELTGVSNDSLQASLGDSWFPHRGLGPMPPTDPTLYRLYEVHGSDSVTYTYRINVHSNAF